MRIAFIVTEFPKVTETFTLREISRLQELGHEVRIYYLTKFRQDQTQHKFAKPLLAVARGAPYVLGGHVLRSVFRAARSRPAKTARALATLIRSYRGNPVLLLKSLVLFPKILWIAEDVQEWGGEHVHATFSGHPGTCAWIINHYMAVPYSMSCHAHDIFRSQAMLGEKINKASFVRPISQYNRQFIQTHVPEVDASKLHVVHCGVDTGNTRIAQVPTDTPLRVLYVGSLQVRKGVDVLLKALASVEGVACEIIGDGPQRQELHKLAQDLGLQDRVIFRGALPFEEVSLAFHRSHVLAVPSIVGPGGRAEGIPTVIMEALAHSVPVIASRITGIPEIVRDGETGFLVEPGDSAGLAEAIRFVERNREEAAARAQRGRSLVCSEFDLATNIAALEKLIRAHGTTFATQE
jgi:colanic acid/amylovoran biosynthesis glycosyltransferase